MGADKLKTLSDFDFKGKTVLLRADLNSDVKDKKILPSKRIELSAKTIEELRKKNAKVVVIAHQGRPGNSDFLPLKQHAKLLNNYTKIEFVPDIFGDKAFDKIKGLKSGEAILLDNIRGIKDEFNPEKEKGNKLYSLVELVDIYVNDAFSVCHREQTSIVLFPKHIPSCIGRVFEREIKALEKLGEQLDDCLYLLGGSKPWDNIKLLGKNKAITGGLFGQLCLIASGKDLGAQNKYLENEIKDYEEILKKLKPKIKNIEMPIDFAVKVDGKRKELSLDEFPSEHEIFDIGKKTQEKYKEELKEVKAVYMKGPFGYCQDKQFSKGTLEILKSIPKKAFSVIGGGHLTSAIKRYDVDTTKFSHISTSGGALLRYIAGEKLPGIEILKSNLNKGL